MRDAEILALVYFLVVGVAALALLRHRAGAPVAILWSTAGVGVTATATLAPTVLRDWWLIVALPLAYWAPARLAGSANERLERWLQSIDDGLGLTRLDPTGHGLLEFAYFLVYPMVPAGLLAINFSRPGMAAEFWLVLFAAVLPCYGLLPLIPTRPPRTFLVPASPDGRPSQPFRRANLMFLATFGNTWNTLPSGHAAGAAAVAVMVWRSDSTLAPVFLVLAIGIAMGTVRGRYHYVVDTLSGVMLGLAAAGLLT
jgi:membrane-associated phospholipid phosphatase